MTDEPQALTQELKLQHWGEGPWVDEPDYVEWEYKGYLCKAWRMAVWEGHQNDHLYGGSINGYVRIPEGHPWHGKDYDDIEADVHGGLTFSSGFEEVGFYIGFDCAHSMDYVPSVEKFKKERIEAGDPILLKTEELKKKYPLSRVWSQKYRTMEFVKSECERLVDQAIEAAK